MVQIVHVALCRDGRTYIFRTDHLVILAASGWYKIPLKWPVRKVSTAEGIGYEARSIT
jgi:hypothetical protein